MVRMSGWQQVLINENSALSPGALSKRHLCLAMASGFSHDAAHIVFKMYQTLATSSKDRKVAQAGSPNVPSKTNASCGRRALGDLSRSCKVGSLSDVASA